RQDQLGDVEVVGEEVALGVTLDGPEDLVEVRKTELAPLGLHPPCVPALLDRERRREFDRERATAGGLLARGHPKSVTLRRCSALGGAGDDREGHFLGEEP